MGLVMSATAAGFPGIRWPIPVMDFVAEVRAGDSSVSAAALAPLIKARFGIEIHRRSIERALGRQEKKAPMTMGRAGIVMGLEVSRLARNSSDWHRLLEICALSDTLILDEDAVYDPSHFNDRLLLGLKGTMSEAELQCTCCAHDYEVASSTKHVVESWSRSCPSACATTATVA